MDFQLRATVASWNEGDRISLPHSVLLELQSEWLHSSKSDIHTRTLDSSSTSIVYSKNNNAHVKEAVKDSTNPFYFELQRLDKQLSFVCGVKDFSAPEGEVCVPAWILSKLQLTEMDSKESVLVKWISIPNATAITLIAKDIFSLSLNNPRAVLENYLRSHFASLTKGITLPISTFQPHLFQAVTCDYYLEDIQPSSPASVINVDVEVKVVPLETDPILFAKKQKEYENVVEAKRPLPLSMNENVELALKPSTSMYYALSFTKELKHVSVSAKPIQGDISVFLHPFLLPNINDSVSFSVHPKKDGAYSLEYPLEQKDHQHTQMILGIHTYGESEAKFSLTWSDHSLLNSKLTRDSGSSWSTNESRDLKDMELCEHCKNWIPKTSFTLHQVRCLRDHIKCPQCHEVYRSTTPHWHCLDCSFIGTSLSDPPKHIVLYHTPYVCPGCHLPFPCAAGQAYQSHRATECSYRRIYCRFCLTYPLAGGPASSVSDRLSGIYSEHESECASRTLDCQVCFKPVPMKHMSVHMQLHQTSVVSGFLACGNQLCGNEMDVSNGLHLCATCFRPFVQTPMGALLKKKVHRYFHQMISGCGHAWCRNKYCKSSSFFEHSGNDATGSALICMELAKSKDSWYCVSSFRLQLRRELAEELSSIYLVSLGTSLGTLLKFENQIWFENGKDDDDDGNENENENGDGRDENIEQDIHKIKERWIALAANNLAGQIK